MLGCGSKELKQQSCGQDAGETWWLWRQVDGGEFGYSAATVLNSTATTATIGLAYSGAGGVRFTAVKNFLPKA